MLALREDFYGLEKEFNKLRSEFKDKYLSDERMTLNDYKGLLDGVPITLDGYQAATEWTAQYPEHIPNDVYLAIGLGGEIGELLNLCKKLHRNDKGVLTDKRKEKILDEASDCLFYLSALLLSFNIKLSDVANHNQIKLIGRLKNNTIKSREND